MGKEIKTFITVFLLAKKFLNILLGTKMVKGLDFHG